MLDKRHEKWLGELENEWVWHNGSHTCLYSLGHPSGVDRCPASYKDYKAFLVSRGFPVEFLVAYENDQISGQDSDATNSRSDIAPVEVDINNLKNSIEELETDFDRLEAQVRQIANENVPDVYERIAKAMEAIAAAVERTNTPIIVSVQSPNTGINSEDTKRMVREFLRALHNYDRMENGMSSPVINRQPVEDIKPKYLGDRIRERWEK